MRGCDSLTAIAEPATVPLISTAYFKPPVLRGLVDTDEEICALLTLRRARRRAAW